MYVDWNMPLGHEKCYPFSPRIDQYYPDRPRENSNPDSSQGDYKIQSDGTFKARNTIF